MPIPGIPPLLGGVSIPSPTVILSDGFDILTGQNIPQWGVFLDGVSVIESDNVLMVEYKQDWSLLDYPVENGGFQSYNKVNSPYEARVRFSCGGSQNDRTQFLQSIAEAAQSLDLYDVVTPEQVYQDVNIKHYDYSRTATNGVGLLTVDVWLDEIRQAPDPAFSNTKQPSGSDPVNDGTVQTSPPTAGQTQSILYGLENGG